MRLSTSLTFLHSRNLNNPTISNQPAEILYQKYKTICQKDHESSLLTQVDMEILLKTAEKANAGSLRIFSELDVDHLLLGGKSIDDKILIGFQDKNSLKQFKDFRTISYTLLDSLQKITIKLTNESFEKDLLSEIDFLNDLSELMLGSIISDNEVIGYAMDSSKMDTYQQKFSHLIKVANQVEKKTFTVLTDCSSPKREKFFAGKSKEGQIQIGLIHPKFIGKGTYGEVFSVSLPLGKIAIKLALDRFDEERLQNEIKILTSLHEDTDLDIIGIQPSPLGHSCKKTLSMADPFFLSSQKGLSMELFEGSYLDYITAVTKISIPSPSFQTILAHLSQLASGLAFLQEKGILHSDIKRANILKKENIVKISDFGSAKETFSGENPDPKNYPYSITPLKNIKELEKIDYTDSEQRLSAIQIALGMDRYQLGDLFWSIWNWTASGYTVCHSPYNLEEFRINDEIREYPKHFYPSFHARREEFGPRDFSSKVKLPNNLGAFVSQMVAVNEATRPSMKEIADTFSKYA